MSHPSDLADPSVPTVCAVEALESRLLLSASTSVVASERGPVWIESGGSSTRSVDATVDAAASKNQKKKSKKKKKKKNPPRGAASATLSGGVLRVKGTAGADTIGISHSQDVKTWQVLVNGRSWLFYEKTVNRIIVQAQAGNDEIVVASPLGAEIFGGDGDDRITGPVGGASLLDGGDGDDFLWGLGQANTFVGGTGKDIFIGSPNDNVVDAEDGELVSLV